MKKQIKEEKKLRLTKMDIWKFVYKEMCRVYQVNFLSDDEYNSFERRFDYFIKSQIKKEMK